MDIEGVKKLLNNYKYNELTINQRERHIEKLKNTLKKYVDRQKEIAGLTNISYDEKEVKKLLEEQLREEKQLIIDIKNKNNIITLINKMPQPSKTILFARYVLNMSFGEIAKDLFYSPKRIYQLHKVAIEEFTETYKNL